MSTFTKGDSFYFPLRQRGEEPHNWFIITAPDKNGMMVAANATDYANNHGDLNCVLQIGDHPRIVKVSVIAYSLAKLVTETQLQKAEAAALLEKREPASAVLLNRIRQGALTSDDMDPRKAKLVELDK